MNTPLPNLAIRIRGDLAELSLVVDRLQEAWRRALRMGDDLYLDSVALNLHGFYSGIERIFERVAETLDDSVPKGENWHKALLDQMSLEVKGIRPAVISQYVRKRLEEYRGFRHVVRNVYTFHFDAKKLEGLVSGVDELFVQVKAELSAFADFLDSQQ